MKRSVEQVCSECPLDEACGVSGEPWANNRNKAQVCRIVHADAYNTLANATMAGRLHMRPDEVRIGHTTVSVRALAEVAHRSGMPVDYPGSVAVHAVANRRD